MEVKEEKMVAQEAEEKAQVQDGEEWVEVEEDVEEGESSLASACMLTAALVLRAAQIF